jgi:DNA mismatch repair protein MutS2
MNYPVNLAEKLGFNQVKEEIKQLCLSPMGLEYADKMRFSGRFPLVKQWVEQVDEMNRILGEHGGEFPQTDYFDLRSYLSPLQLEGHYLSADEWRDWQRALTVLYETIRFFAAIDATEYPEIHKITQHFIAKGAESNGDFRQILPIIQDLDRVFDTNGQIKETASPALGDLRRQRIAEEQSLRKKLDSYLSQAYKEGWVSKDFSLTLRNGRMVIPLAAEHKRKIKGFVQDESDTGKTVFLEPADALAMNNEIKSLESAERREVIQILSKLSDRIRPLTPFLVHAFSWLGLIDFIRAKALWGAEHKAIKPTFIQDKPIVNWTDARHPLLEKSLEKIGKKIKPLTIRLEDDRRIMVVSGPNAGGKSVTLSTVGLLQFLFQSGCLVPLAEGSTMGFFSQLFLDMGDEQNLENELSTYSSHLSNMRHFLQHVNEKTLILVDEFGTGTEPSLGGAIAESILEKLADKGCYGAINTHFGNLKSLADRQKGLFNAAMRYDTEHLEPQFILDMGKPGSSFAFEIAQKIGLPKVIIENARKKLGKKQVDFDKLLLETETEKQIWESKNASLALANEQALSIKDNYERLKNHVQEEQKAMLNAAKAEAKKIIQEANQRIEQTIRQIKEKEADKEKTKELRADLEQFVQKELKTETPLKVVSETPGIVYANSPIAVGDWVVIKGSGDEPTLGQIIELKGKDAVISLGAIRSTIKLNRLQKIVAPKQPKKSTAPLRGIDINDRMAQFQLKLDIRGKRAEEVYVILDQYINDCLLLGVPEVQILHGKGDGILRTLIREQLRRYKEIKNSSDEHADRGGAGITIVTFK